MKTETCRDTRKEAAITNGDNKDFKVSNVLVVPGAPARNLPFVHSKFKSRAKFAKTFNGCGRFSKLKPRDGSWGLYSKLPCIKFEENSRQSKTSLNSVSSKTRGEYPGFTGNSKVRVRIENRSNPTTKKGMLFTGLTMDYDKGPNPTGLNETFKATHRADNSHAFTNKEDTVDLLPDLDSLFIIDESESDNGYKRQGIDLSNSVLLSCTSESAENEDAIIESDFFAKGVNRKLRDAAQISGMKKVRTHPKDADIRLLGDVITSERFKELLSPRRTLPSFKFQ